MTAEKIQQLLDKDAIRELVLLYSRGVDRKDAGLLRDLYTEDATDTHGDSFNGGAEAYCDFLERAFPHMPYSGHHVCNHLIAVDGDTGIGEVYAIAWHVIPDQQGGGGLVEDLMCVRYLDNYRRCRDGQWRFSKRLVIYDMRMQRPFHGSGEFATRTEDPSYGELAMRLFQRGARS